MTTLHLLPQKEHLIFEAYLDFILSRKAKLLSPRTIEFYEYTAGGFANWLQAAGISEPAQLRAYHVRGWLTDAAERGLSQASIHSFARGARAFLRFLHREGYTEKLIEFEMPRVEQKRKPVLTTDDIRRVLAACKQPRDSALVLLLLDTGLRASELLALAWDDIDISSGIVRVDRGKGGKARTVVIGANTRRALLKYRRTTAPEGEKIFRLKRAGLRMALQRIGDRAGLHLNPHKFRRTYATMSLKNGINPLHLQALMGHSSLEMTRQYITMIDDDLVVAHRNSSPVDNLF